MEPVTRLTSAASLPWKANGLLGWSLDPSVGYTSILQPTSAFIFLSKIMVPETITISNFNVLVTQGGNSYSNAQLGLYSSAGVYLGASAVLASAGTNTFGSNGAKTIAIDTPQLIIGSPTAFVWVGLHLGVNAATFVQFPQHVTSAVNLGTTAATSRYGTYAGHATNNLATIGNLTPASITPANNPGIVAVS
jgi:hypothetical protein